MMQQNQQNTNAFLIHISAFMGFIFPFGHIIAPLIAWQTLKDRSSFLDKQGKEAVNFNMSYTLYSFILTAAFIPLAFNTFFNNFDNFTNANNFHFNFDFNPSVLFGFVGVGILISILHLVGIALVIIASLKAKKEENYTYPFTIKFIK
ncbi:DUF4870 domain-containing protein [uncultured Polaribacter sp.]|uniref:DUF4870 domain-containing protein n=1 Tax=uncultured Polaribacter sp. TaxID=174711 RepID=UPI0032B219F7|tara:strand:- start:2259 stop:2702 length:444 start_codon:yes stop_codon:yes gene_type:complete